MTDTPTWVVYKPASDSDPLFIEPTGIEGTWDGQGDPTQLASNILTEHADDQPTWIVEVYTADGRLKAWAEWQDGAPVTHLILARIPRATGTEGA